MITNDDLEVLRRCRTFIEKNGRGVSLDQKRDLNIKLSLIISKNALVLQTKVDKRSKKYVPIIETEIDHIEKSMFTAIGRKLESRK